MFENIKDYQNQRKQLLDEAQSLLTEGKMEEMEAKTKAVEELDNAWDSFSKAQANLNALNDSRKSQVGTIADFSQGINRGSDDLFDTADYRKAFMNYTLKGTVIPAEFKNADESTKTTDIGAVIPTTVMNRIIEKMESSGMILPLVTRTAYKGGVSIPTSSAKPTAVWVAEGAGSDRQKKTTGNITFNYHKLRCAVSVSLETDAMALSAFETTLINNVSEAMVKALEQAIISGSGTGQPKGIITEAVPEGQALALTGDPTYQTLIDAESALPLAYESGAVWFMSKSTFMKFEGMTDGAGQPIARINYGISNRPERILLGRSVVLNDYLPAWTAAEDSAIVAFLFNPKDYLLNTNLNLTVKRYEDNDTDDFVTKAIMLVDGKVVDVNSLVTLSKTAAAAKTAAK